MKKFEVGKEYADHSGNVRKCTKKTDKSVWFDDCRYALQTDSKGNEYTTTIIRIKDFQAN